MDIKKIRNVLQFKLETIEEVWSNFIFEYKFLQNKINFTAEVKTNYFGDMVGYFQDTLDIIFSNRAYQTHSDKFIYQISLLQSIYVQQDFIEEFLSIFKIEKNRRDLNKDSNYKINRDIRNELVGHPIRKYRERFISSCLFGYNGENEKITYLRYHKENNYDFESMEFEISDIILRHNSFLTTYFDIILARLKKLLGDHRKEIENLETLIDIKQFSEIIDIVSVHYESIFESDNIYDKRSLQKIYLRKEEHLRYKHLITRFYDDLKTSLNEKKEYSIKLFEPKKEDTSFVDKIPLFDRIKFVDPSIQTTVETSERSVTFHYELGKLATKRNQQDFAFFSGILRSKCANNQVILDELRHMELNIDNKIEYYCAYRLIHSTLQNKF
ncbi:hypothetical protein [Elizabethkingia ursingii]|uniref:Uncharacterized protein n=1 Tax=Elizabethkingia ursingii TaxID=1756150 RepID=A0ABX3N6M2_9FLAO|nr:hypothetical protein [Elizabethkingia ursingii]OPB87019.1 hypothetical protein BB021_10935 [Elizabethkingia ursingii]